MSDITCHLVGPNQNSLTILKFRTWFHEKIWSFGEKLKDIEKYFKRTGKQSKLSKILQNYTSDCFPGI